MLLKYYSLNLNYLTKLRKINYLINKLMKITTHFYKITILSNFSMKINNH